MAKFVIYLGGTKQARREKKLFIVKTNQIGRVGFSEWNQVELDSTDTATVVQNIPNEGLLTSLWDTLNKLQGEPAKRFTNHVFHLFCKFDRLQFFPDAENVQIVKLSPSDAKDEPPYFKDAFQEMASHRFAPGSGKSVHLRDIIDAVRTSSSIEDAFEKMSKNADRFRDSHATKGPGALTGEDVSKSWGLGFEFFEIMENLKTYGITGGTSHLCRALNLLKHYSAGQDINLTVEFTTRK